MKKILLPLLALVLALVLVIPAGTPVAACDEPPPLQVCLIAGGGNPKSEMPAGVVHISQPWAGVLRVAFGTGDWALISTHLAVGEIVNGEITGIPLNGAGNPKIGKFPYEPDYADPNFVVYYIPLGDWGPGTQLAIAAHAVVYKKCLDQEETAWGAFCDPNDRSEFSGRSWATYIPYTVQ